MNFKDLERIEEKLFDEWSSTHGSKQFIKDGILNNELFNGTSPKILLLAKEANDPDNDVNWDLREGLRKGGKGENGNIWRNWNVVARWVCNLMDDTKSWSQLKSVDIEFRKKWLNKIAVINAKKTGGGSSHDWTGFPEYVKNYGDFVYQQISLYKPNLIIGGVYHWSVYKSIFKDDLSNEMDYRRTSHDIGWFKLKGWDCIVIDYFHHGYRIPHPMLHYGLIDAYKEIKLK